MTVDALGGIDLSIRLDQDDYRAKLRENQRRLYKLSQKARKRLSTVLAFEGWDGAGKGGAIRRVSRLNARKILIVPVAAPNDEERGHHYLWRFWRHLPRQVG